MRNLVLSGVLVLLASGCASFQNNARQDYVYAMAKPCEGNGVQLRQVNPDGSWTGSFSGGAYTIPEFRACLEQQMSNHPFGPWLLENNREDPAGVSVRRDGSVK
jgi:hypothetical protein